MSQISVYPIQAFSDNYIWCIHDQTHCILVDPGDAQPAMEFMEQQGLTLTHIIITHHHWDHTNGIEALKQHFPQADVYGPNNPSISLLDHHLQEGDHVKFAELGIEFSILEVPGHTLDHIAYHGPVGLFCGDTLFSAGCGRLFEGSPTQMHQSLQRLASLPANTKVYCTHEYTMANLSFAVAVEPNNTSIHEYQNWAKQQRANNQPTLPSNIEQQQAINPFLRCNQLSVKNAVEKWASMAVHKDTETFTYLRKWKDNF